MLPKQDNYMFIVSLDRHTKSAVQQLVEKTPNDRIWSVPFLCNPTTSTALQTNLGHRRRVSARHRSGIYSG